MGKEIESRVVEMRFDNKQFMAGIKETLLGLLNMKKSLNDVSKSSKSFDTLSKAANSVSLAGIDKGIDMLTKRFSTMGIVGMRVIENLTDAVMGKLSSAVHMVSDSIVSGGIRRSMNLENAHFQLQALLKDEEKVQEVMDNANTAVDGTAYSLDEAAKAASQFAASGIQAGDEMVNALRGIVGTAAMTNDSFEHMSSIFTTVAGNGRLMGDQLLQLSAGGLNAASTIADFMNGIIDGSKEASEEVKNLVMELTGGMEVSEGAIREMVTDGQISFKIFSEAMTDAFADSAERANETFTGALSNMKSALARIGAGFISPLVAQNSEVVKLFNAVRVKINDVKSALVFDEEIGNVDALSKQTTDLILNLAKAATTYIEDLDLSKPLESFYYWVKASQNSVKGFWMVLKPFAKAFQHTFLDSITFDTILDFSKSVEKLTQNFKLSKKEMVDLYGAGKGLFDIIKLLGDGIFGLIGLIIPVKEPIKALGEGLIHLSGNAGRTLTRFTEWVRSSETIKKSYDQVSKSVEDFMYGLAHLDDTLREVKKELLSVPVLNKSWQFLMYTFETMGNVFSPYVKEFGDYLSDLGRILQNTVTRETDRLYNNFITTINNLGKSINELDFTKASAAVDWFAGKLTGLFDMLASNESLVQYIKNMGAYVKYGVEHLTLDNLYDALGKFGDFVSGALSYVSFENFFKTIDMFREKVDDFIKWINKKVGPVFSDFNFGGAFAIAGGGGIVFAILKIAKAFESLSKSVKTIPDTFKSLLDSIKDTLKAYQMELKASALIKVAGAIAILAGALVLLSFADMDKVDEAAKTLVSVSTILILGFHTFSDAINAGKTAEDAAYVLSKGLKRAMSKLSGAVRIGAVALAFREFGTMMLKIVGSIIALAMMYKKDKTSVDEALKIIGIIAGVAVGGMLIMSGLSKKMGEGNKNFTIAATGVLEMAFSLYVIIKALKQLFDLELPKDYETKLKIFAGIFVGLAVLIKIMQKSSVNVVKGAVKAGPIVGIAVSIYLIVSALNKLFKMEIPVDAPEKLMIFAGIFGALGYVIKAIGKAAGMAGGSLKAFGTIISICIFLGVAVAALGFLAILPADRLLHGAEALGGILIALGISLRGAGKITSKNSYKSILAMAVAAGAIALSLGLLSMISWENLSKGVISLGSILLILSRDFEKAGKMHKKNTTKAIAAMVAAVVVISSMLVVLAAQPWSGLLVAAGALSAVLLSFAKAIQIIGDSKAMKKDKLKSFLESMLIFVPITAALYLLSQQPWQGLLAAGAAIYMVMSSFSETLKMISSRTGLKKEKIDEFLKASLALIPIGIALTLVASQPWSGILAAGAALSGTVLAFSYGLKIISSSRAETPKIKAFAMAMVELVAIAAILYELSNQPWEGLLAAGTAMSEVILAFSAATWIISKVSVVGAAGTAGLKLMAEIIAGFAVVVAAFVALNQIEGFDEMLAGGIDRMVEFAEGMGRFFGAIVKGLVLEITSSFPQIATDLSNFMNNLQGFLDGAEKIKPDTSVKIKMLADSILLLAGAELVDAIAKFVSKGTSLADFGAELSSFMGTMGPFFEAAAGLKTESMEAVKKLAEVVLIFTTSELIDGITKLFGGGTSKSLADFGAELAALAPSLKLFAITCNGITPDMVTGAADAAKILAEMAKSLPKVDGFAQQVFGTNKSLSQFGAELFVFGPYLVGFAAMVQGVKPEAVEGAQQAGLLMAELEQSLPKQDGWWQKVAGSNDLARFGESMKAFGESLVSFQTTVASINLIVLSMVITACKNLAEFANSLDANSSYNIVNFSIGLESIAVDGINKFVEAFNNCDERVIAAVDHLIITATSKLQEGNDKFKLKGTAAIVAWRNGFKVKHIWDTLTPMGMNLCLNVLTGISKKQADFKTAGIKSSSMYIAGMKSLYTASQNAGRNLAQNALNGISQISFFTAGANATQGFIDGLNSKIGQVIAAGTTIAQAALNATQVALNEHSPSKKYFQAGDYGTIGFINGLLHNLKGAQNAGEKVANASMSGIIETINSDDFTNPVITPKLDASGFNKSAMDMLKMFNDAILPAYMDVRGINNAMSQTDTREMDSLISAVKDLKDGLNNMPRNTYQFGNIQYQEGDEVSSAIETLVRAVRIKQRV